MSARSLILSKLICLLVAWHIDLLVAIAERSEDLVVDCFSGLEVRLPVPFCWRVLEELPKS